MESILSAHELIKNYGATTALNNITINLPRGKIIGLLGPNSSGKTTFLKLFAGLLTPTSGTISIAGLPVGTETKSIVSYLPERTYLPGRMYVEEAVEYFSDFYSDFDCTRALNMLDTLQVPINSKMQTLSKGTKEKVQLILVMSRRAQLYLLDEPIGGVDPATRDYILHTIVKNFDVESSLIIATHLIWDIEQILDEYMFLQYGVITHYNNVQQTRETTGKSIDQLFREVFRW